MDARISVRYLEVASERAETATGDNVVSSSPSSAPTSSEPESVTKTPGIKVLIVCVARTRISSSSFHSGIGTSLTRRGQRVHVSLGTETDGSITCPSSWGNVVGIKPSVGLTSRAGVIPISEHQDSVGPMTRTVKDTAIVLNGVLPLLVSFVLVYHVYSSHRWPRSDG